MNKMLRNTIPVLILGSFGAFIAYAQTPSPAPSQSITASSSDQTLGIPILTPFVAPSPILPNLNANPLVQPLSIAVTPASPSPGQSVTVEAQAVTFDSDRANFVWTVDGVSRPDLSGFGKNTFTFTAGSVGSQKRVSVRAEPTGDTPITASKTIYITDLSLTWTAHTYIPKWYKGKALPVPNATIRIAAIPTFIIDGTPISANRLIYTWDIDGNRVLKGIGKQVLEFKQPEQSWDDYTIVLNVQDAARRIDKEARIGIASQETRAVIYQTLPLGGIEFRRGTSAFPSIVPGIVDLQAEPFFFNKESRFDLSYQWSAQNIIVSNAPKNPFIFTIDMSEQRAGNVPVTVLIQDPDSSAPPASGFLNIPIRP